MTVLIAAAFLLLQCLCQVLATVVECGGPLPSGYVKYPGDNTANKVYTEKLTWYDARERCLAEGADLAGATTHQKVLHIRNLHTGLPTWIGIHRPSGRKGGDWVRVDTGLPVPFSSLPWSYFGYSANDKCAVTYVSGSIHNRPCTKTYPFACGISLAEGCPGSVGTPDAQDPQSSKDDDEFPVLTESRGEEEKPEEMESDESPEIPDEKRSMGNAGAPGPRGLTGPAGYCIVALLYIVNYAVA